MCVIKLLVTPVHTWKFDRFPQEEYKQIIENKVTTPFFSVELECQP